MQLSTTIADIAGEAQRVVSAATDQGTVVRISGGVAFQLRVRGRVELPRAPAKDIDLVVPGGTERRVSKLVTGLGYDAEKAFNARHGETRLMFWDPARDRKLEIFVGTFLMCHQLPIARRLRLERETVPLAELLLTKLQIVELNEKDVADMHMLLASHEVGSADGEVINTELIAQLCAVDWGLHHTVTRTLSRLHTDPPSYRLDPGLRKVVDGRIDRIEQAIDRYPKTVAWRLRSKVGERVPWYVQPEEFE